MKFELERATDGKHKWVGVFTDADGKETRVPFGAVGYQDFTQHHNRVRRSMYLLRHRKNENWNDPMTAGALSRWLLWGDVPHLETNVRTFKKRFNLE